MKKLIYTLITFLLLMTTKNISAAGRSVDVTKLDVAGVKLGMTMDQAVKAITSNLGISQSRIKFQSTTSFNTESQKKIKKITGKIEITNFKVSTANGNYIVSFLPNVLNGNNKQMVVVSVGYSMPRNSDNIKTISNSMVQKYGQPSAQVGGLIFWCLSPENDSCIYSRPAKPYISLNVTMASMAIVDNGYEQAIDKYFDKQKTTKAVF
ncbi:hypothetical protein [Entomomonas asaccharolytica]|uniref:Uncharacterized protein n=1 Tax=Entomomonas asaccharolytica TaxID=2785331 RepID=A0A974NDF1_9GAMM|nr:hypothetical protein [Entomomonas asaccharolytica]QQP84539.1 hypothetical protein JHT90_08940 [Entomomonas asaccharolytica]